ncbi:transporter [Flavobacterium sp.]|uniref:transporter n=1 Tax=Flavobacterium sp. TaxID=239 RepID=UPI00286DF2E7|nr:transporter [Flavobacterium sp.]
MKYIKILFVIAIYSFTTTIYSQFTDQINTNRPGSSMGAFSVGKNVYQAEGGVTGFKSEHSLLEYDDRGFAFDLAARGGLFFEQLELILEAEFQFDQYTNGNLQYNRSGITRTTFGGKYLIYDPFKKKKNEKPNIYSWKANQKPKWRQYIPAISGYAGVNYVFDNEYSIPNESTINPKIMILAQNHFTSGLVVVTNIIADKIGSENSSFGYVLTVTKSIGQKWTGFIENKGIKGDYYSDGIFTLGTTYLLASNMQIDASISKNIKDTPSLLFGGVGFSWRFDKKHKDKEKKAKKEVEGNSTKPTTNIKTQDELDKIQSETDKKAEKKEPETETEKTTEEPKKLKRLDDLENIDEPKTEIKEQIIPEIKPENIIKEEVKPN